MQQYKTKTLYFKKRLVPTAWGQLKNHTRIKNYTLEKRTHEEKQRATDSVKCCFQHHILIYFKTASLVNHVATSKKEKINEGWSIGN